MSGLPSPDPAATCLVTGASSGIGAALARELSARGYGVTLVARREERLRSLAAELTSAYGTHAEALPCDLADPSARAALPKRVAALGLRVDLLASNAGLGSHGRFTKLDPAGEVQQIRVMCEAAIDLCGTFVPPMVQRRAGAVLIVASISAFQPVPNTATYGAAKAFLLSFGEALHTELRGSGVAVTTLCPGPVRTEFFDPRVEHPSERIFPASLWKNPKAIAGAGIRGLARNRRVVIPGGVARLLAGSGRFSPHFFQLRVVDRLYRGRSLRSPTP
jgi:short-subunit dehydrogenase